MEFYNAIKSKPSSRKEETFENEDVHLESHDMAGGSYLIDHKKGHIVAIMEKTPRGLAFSGKGRHVTFFGGRNEWGGIADKMKDGIYHN
jgi:hypothetical protein